SVHGVWRGGGAARSADSPGPRGDSIRRAPSAGAPPARSLLSAWPSDRATSAGRGRGGGRVRLSKCAQRACPRSGAGNRAARRRAERADGARVRAGEGEALRGCGRLKREGGGGAHGKRVFAPARASARRRHRRAGAGHLPFASRALPAARDERLKAAQGDRLHLHRRSAVARLPARRGSGRMIAALRGVVLEKNQSEAILDANGVGYRVHFSLLTAARLPDEGQPVKVRIRTVVREDALELFGFLS